jgi:hypothetical protein
MFLEVFWQQSFHHETHHPAGRLKAWHAALRHQQD